MNRVEVPQRPLLKPWYRVGSMEGRTILQHLESVVVLKGRAADRLLPVLLPLLDGTRSLDEIVAELGEPARPAIEQAVALLNEHGLLTNGVALRTPLKESAEFVTAGDPLGSLAERADALAGSVVAVLGSGRAALE